MGFRKKIHKAQATRRRNQVCSEEDSVEGGSSKILDDEASSEWLNFLKRPAPATNTKIESLREAGCMIRFLVCQTSISVSAAEVLGQISFQEHFPIDGVAQEKSKSTKPLPKWVYYMMFFVFVCFLCTLFCVYHVGRVVMFGKRSGSVALET